jgi:DNA-binding MarR family transcriptional regulator
MRTETVAEHLRADPPAGEFPAGELMELLGRLRRSVRRLVRQGWAHQPLTESEVELLRLLGAQPGLRVREAAATLSLVPNTVSTLVGKLSAQGLLERRADASDARAARLYLSPAAARRMAAWRDRRQQVVGAVLATLPRSDRDAVARAIPALRLLVEEVERR